MITVLVLKNYIKGFENIFSYGTVKKLNKTNIVISWKYGSDRCHSVKQKKAYFLNYLHIINANNDRFNLNYVKIAVFVHDKYK